MQSGGKPFACDQCEYSNTRRHHLKTHKLNSGKKPFVCDQCEYSSTQAQALKRHKLKHSWDRPHACNATNAITLPQRLRLLKYTRWSTMMKTLLHAISASILPDRLWNSKHISYKHTVARGPFLPLKLWISKDTSYRTVTKSLIHVTNVTFPSDSNHTCESTVKKNLTHVSNVTTNVSDLKIWKKHKTRKQVIKTLK